MRNVVILLAIVIFSCKTIEKPFDRIEELDNIQVKLANNPQPDCCYAKLKMENGNSEFYKVICRNNLRQNTTRFEAGLIALRKLDYSISDESIKKKFFNKEDIAELVKYQKKNKLAYGSLDEATLYYLMNEVKNLPVKSNSK